MLYWVALILLDWFVTEDGWKLGMARVGNRTAKLTLVCALGRFPGKTWSDSVTSVSLKSHSCLEHGSRRMNWVPGVSPRHSSFDVSAVVSCALGFRVRHANRIAGNERRCFIVESNDDGVARFKRIREDAVEKVSSYAHDRGLGFGECLFELMGGDSDDDATLSSVLDR